MKTNSVMKKILNNWPAKIFCFLIALCIVFVVRFGLYNKAVADIPLQIKLPQGYEAQNKLDSSIRLTISGDRKLIYLIRISEIQAVADFTAIEEDLLQQAIAENTPLTVPVDLVYNQGVMDISEQIIFTSAPSKVRALLKRTQ